VLAVYLTAHIAFRLDARVQAPATMVATLLAVDAWFDVTTSTSGKAATEALILALVVELPAAASTAAMQPLAVAARLIRSPSSRV
jgi:hypothetical protein